MSETRAITACEVCGNSSLVPLLDLGNQPLCDDLIPIGSDATVPLYPIRLVGCPQCITVHQAVQVEKERLFPQSYHYRGGLTADVVDGMSELVAAVARHVGGLEGRLVLDLGCNDGTLLGLFGERGATTAGIEPTAAALEAKAKAGWLRHGYFDANAVEAFLANNPRPDIVTFTNVFAHIENLPELLVLLGRVMKPTTLLVIENHYLGEVVARAQFDTFYHEHPRTYSLRSFEVIAASLGRNIEAVSFPPRYNGNVRIFMGDGPSAILPALGEDGLLAGVVSLKERAHAARQRIRDILAPLVKKHGPLPGKAFPGRAAILVHCFGLDEEMIDATYERPRSPKIGHYVPGTRIEIRDETELFEERLNAAAIINFAWHIQDEIMRYVRAAGYRGAVVPVQE